MIHAYAPVVLAILLLAGCAEQSSATSMASGNEASGAAADNAVGTDPRCNPSFTAEQCDTAMRALERDAEQLAEEMGAEGQPAGDANAQEDSERAALQHVQNEECAAQKAQLASLRRMQTPAAGEQLSKEELDSLPSLIETTQDYIERNCG